MTRLLFLAVGVTAGVVIALSLVYRREPVARAPLYREDDDGIQPWDPYTSGTYRAPDGTQWSWSTRQAPDGTQWSWTGR